MSISRRDWLTHLGGGLGSVVLADWLQAQPPSPATHRAPQSTPGGLHFPAKVQRVIQLFMNGGASPMDTFDYKPELARLHGQALGPKEKPEGFTAPAGAVMNTPFPFQQHGECGQWVSSVFPHQAGIVDDLAFLMAMSSKTNVHGPASYMMNTGFIVPGFPCLGAWISYALGDERQELPRFVVLPDPRGLPYNQKGNFSAAFLPARHQGTVVDVGRPAPIPDLFPEPGFEFATGTADAQTAELLRQFNRRHAESRPDDTRLEARLAAAELAGRMQLTAPAVFQFADETPQTLADYGLDRPETEDFGRRCLLARRLVERGTRFVQVWSGPQGATSNWDNHGSIPKELPPIALSVDKPIAGLVRDLKQRGLLADTLVIWTTEFGRTPFAQGSDGRDHNKGTFVTWLAGAGIRAGSRHGRSDDLAYETAEGQTFCYDLHATILHLLGIDHQRLTFRSAGIDRRLTDVHGHVIHEILA